MTFRIFAQPVPPRKKCSACKKYVKSKRETCRRCRSHCCRAPCESCSGTSRPIPCNKGGRREETPIQPASSQYQRRSVQPECPAVGARIRIAPIRFRQVWITGQGGASHHPADRWKAGGPLPVVRRPLRRLAQKTLSVAIHSANARLIRSRRALLTPQEILPPYNSISCG